MKKIGIFMADGCEEIEGLTVVDIVRRAGMEITMISISEKRSDRVTRNCISGRCVILGSAL